MTNIKQELENIKLTYDKTIERLPGLFFSQKNEIRDIEFYSDSKYLNGQKDEGNRDKPFMQILNGVCDVENSAKDIDTKDVAITSDDDNHYLESFLMTKDVYVWMKDANFAKTLNDMRNMHTRYGSLLVKKVMKEGELTIELPEWKNLITDQVDLIGGAIIETHWMTAMDLAKKKDVWDKDAIKKIMMKFKGLGSTTRCPIYEIRGEFPKAYMLQVDNERIGNRGIKKEIQDDDFIDFSYQLHIISGNPKQLGEGNFVEGLEHLWYEDDTERIYKYLARKPKSGRAFGVGVMEEGKEAQVGTNDALLKQTRAMEYTSKVIGQTASKKLKGRNLLTETDDGVILETEDGKPITALNLLPSGGLAQYPNVMTQWYNQLERVTSAYSAQRGDDAASGTPFRLQAMNLQQSSSVFKDLLEEMGIFYTEIFEDWIIPFLATKLNKQHILAYDFTPEELKEIDHNFSTRHANKKLIDDAIAALDNKSALPTQENYNQDFEQADTFIKGTKAQRFIEIPKDFYKNINTKVTINITGEQKNKAAVLESISNFLQLYGSNPGLSQDPVASQLFARAVELSGAGISPIAITAAMNEKNKASAQQAQQQQAQQSQQSQQAVPSPTLAANPNPVIQ